MARHAVVIGGGPAGTLTAYALLGRVGSVTVFERDRHPPDPPLTEQGPDAWARPLPGDHAPGSAAAHCARAVVERDEAEERGRGEPEELDGAAAGRMGDGS
jgi:flavin-dependent dehydrogenase